MALDLHPRDEAPLSAVTHLPVVAAPDVAHRLHPAIYVAIVGLALVFIASAWAFDAPNDTYYLLAIITGFVLAAIGLPFQLWRVRRHGHDPRDSSLSRRTLSNWLKADFDIWQTRIKGRDAAVAIVLPVAAAAICMLSLAIVLHIDVG